MFVGSNLKIFVSTYPDISCLIFTIDEQICFVPVNSDHYHLIVMTWIPNPYQLVRDAIREHL